MSLYPFQIEGARWLAERPRAYLADQMRLGKTLQTATAAGLAGVRRVLVVAPANAIENWHREWEAWGPKVGLDVISWANPGLSTLAALHDLVVLDEAHYAKNPAAKRTRAAFGVAAAAPRAWLLSGTPMPNHPGELYPALNALWPEIVRELGVKSYQHWLNKFCVMKPSRFGPPKPIAMKDGHLLAPHLKQIMLRRTIDGVGIEMPPITMEVSLLEWDAGFARELELSGVNPELLHGQIDAEDGEQGSVSRLRRLLGEYKSPLIAKQIAAELDDGAYGKIVVMAHHKAVLDIFRKALAPFGVVGFDGSATSRQRQEAVDRFRDGDARVFVGQQSAAGIAINLAAADEIVLVEPAWTPAENAQAILRIRDIRKTRPVRARIFAMAHSLDEALMGVVVRKAKMQRELGL